MSERLRATAWQTLRSRGATGLALVCLLTALGCSSADEDPPQTVPDVSGEVLEPPPIPPLEAPHLLFRDITTWAGLDFPGNATASGATFMDLNGDGFDDLLIPGPDGTHVMHNRGNGSFELVQVIEPDPPMVYTYAMELTGDDQDDVLLIHELGAEAWEVTDGKLVPRRDLLLLEDLVLQPAVATLGDFSGSGYLDIFLGRSVVKDEDHIEPDPNNPNGVKETPAPDVLLRRDGDGYADVTAAVGLDLTAVNTLAAMSTDLDGDGRVDLIVGTQHDVPDRYLRSRSNGTFEEAGAAMQLISEENLPLASTSAMGFDAQDVDGDGDVDLYLTDDNPTFGDRLYRQTAPGIYEYATESAGLEATKIGVGWGVGFHDFDQDGNIDLFVANGRRFYPEGSGPEQENYYFRGDGQGHFSRPSAPDESGLSVIEQSFGAVFSDIDNDGDLDVLVLNADRPATLLRNDHASGHWLQVSLKHPTLSPVVGAIVTATAGPQTWTRRVNGTPSFGGSSTARVHLGLGSATEVSLRVTWPDGTTTDAGTVAADTHHTVTWAPAQ